MNIYKKLYIKLNSKKNHIVSIWKTYFYNLLKVNNIINKDIKKIKVFDVFIFFNELELLELRLNILDQYVDYFVIIESNKTFTGIEKPLFFQENKIMFEKWKDKIIYYTVYDMPNSNSDKNCDQEILNMANNSYQVPKDQIHWLREFYQKEMMKKPLSNKANDEDFCFISDIDEIWNPESIIDYSKNNIFKFKQSVYTYFINNRSSEHWYGTFATKYKNIKNNSITDLDSISLTSYVYIKNGGWHFTNMGGVDKIKQKINSYGHQEFNNQEILSQIENKIKENKDFVGRKFKFWTDESDLPKYLIENKDKYKNLFK